MMTSSSKAPPGLALAETTGLPRILTLLEAGLGRVVETAAGLLVLAEVVILLAGVVSRYVFHAPLVWSDELASILFLWLAMLGSVVALRRGEHMRMTAIVNAVSPGARAVCEAVGLVAALAFLALIFHPAYEYAADEIYITTPALEIPNVWRAAALPVGVGLMIVVAVSRLLRQPDWKRTALAAAAVVAVCAAAYMAQPALKTLGNLNLVVFFVIFVGATVLAGVPIAFCFALATFGYLALTTSMPLTIVVSRMDEGMSHLILLAVPLFVFLGVLIDMTGMGFAMVRFLGNLLGHVRGGLSYVLVGAMYLVSGISGSKAADMAAIAPVLVPEMEKRGSKRGDLLALLSATGAQTETIPPSLVLITVGSVTGISIAALFAGGLVPALVLGICLCFVIWYRHRGLTGITAPKVGLPEIGRSLLIALPAIILPFLIRAAVIEGVATATEVSTLGIVYAVVVGLLVYRKFDWRRIGPMLADTASLSGAILLIIGGATAMGWALTQSGFSTSLANFMGSLPGGATTFLGISLIAFVILGSLLEGIPAIVLFGPLMFPIAKQLGIHEVHYAMVVVIAMGIGLFAPPFGVGYYAAAAIAKINPDEGMKPMVAYILAMIVGLVIVTLFPILSTGFIP
ncbi:TRAP transporter large permease [Azospirillum agricola]|uniref:TRAP transporter large permease n=1 Tax=Azospirillum agricola TaxID=1720247 RepID=UPI000A0F2EB3|nr:TRAP transporter large permease subunit [Azospirillum agricola]SMH46668.1 TRAP transporter, DctM subunit [Azospirillum lipoferum]